MKSSKIKILAASLLLGGLIMTGCGGGSSSSQSSSSGGDSSQSSQSGSSSQGGTLEQADKVFKNQKAYFDTSLATIPNLSLELSSEASVTELAVGRDKAGAGEYSLSGKVLTIAGSFLKKLSAGEKTLSVTQDGKTVKVALFAATKVITTAEQFQAINDNLTGYYVLGNDIDLSSIDNFEPLGYYFTETDPTNSYFHGVLEGNGYSVKNAHVYYSDDVSSNYNAYANSGTHFQHDAHLAGDNIGLFQVIGSSGVVRNVNFSNIKIRGRTICGVIAGNCAGTVTNCHIDSGCAVEMGTHFYDNDCNMGGAFGIVSGGASVTNVISENTSLTLGATSTATAGGVAIERAGIYLDFADKYIGETGNGWDHGEGTDNNWWKYCAVDRDKLGESGKQLDSNGAQTNGEYAFVGKCWGTVSNCVAKAFKYAPMDGTVRDIFFGQTHLAVNKPTSGENDMGTLSDNKLISLADMKKAENYSSFDTSVWSIEEGKIPSLLNAYNF